LSGGNPDLAAEQAILRRFGIDPDSYENGVWLPGQFFEDPLPEAFHQPLHTKIYFRNLHILLGGAKTRQEAVETLRSIGDRLARNDTTLY